jgi:putative phage-type endonuclease|tara:strand:- start:8140 stop:9012 length:873 start_codon:yes stop_codon:yes gene_type:complete
MTDEPYNHLTDPARKKRITASMVGAILGNSPWMTRDDAMRRMVRDALDAPSEFEGNIATEYGNRNEPGAIIEFQMETGLSVEPARFTVKDDWAGCSPDGIASDGNGLEVKCPFGLRDAESPVPFKILEEQPQYFDQVQFSLWVTGRTGWYFWQWRPTDTDLSFATPSQEWQDKNLPVLRQFHAEFLDELKNPDDHLAPKRVTIDTPAAHRAIKEWDEINEQAELLKERKADLLKSMVDMAGGKNALFAGRKLSLTTREGSVSYAKVVKDHCKDVDLEPYRGKPSSYWGIR